MPTAGPPTAAELAVRSTGTATSWATATHDTTTLICVTLEKAGAPMAGDAGETLFGVPSACVTTRLNETVSRPLALGVADDVQAGVTLAVEETVWCPIATFMTEAVATSMAFRFGAVAVSVGLPLTAKTQTIFSSACANTPVAGQV